ncbi:anamorsin homolog [Linepithema humile]|uniref:anamorsin homolog n=1 Tax=Linepithema humile TaxID=83485 RepID=UPI000623644E|nr:PREDICTED: anamorsin homolog [Linepithema humile]
MTSLVNEGNEVLLVAANEVLSENIADFIAAIKQRIGNIGNLQTTNLSNLKKENHNVSSFNVIIVIFKEPCTNDEFLIEALRILKPNGSLLIYEPLQAERKLDTVLTHSERISKLKLSGFTVKDVEQKKLDEDLESENLLSKVYNNTEKIYEVLANKPSFEVGSSVPLLFAKKETNVWKLDDPVEEDLIDEDELLDESDFMKPDVSSLKVCSTTGKRKACKDCSCGLAEELSGKTPQENTVKSSCGSCYLGDAFRCASCPYLGMPAFKPGEKIILSETQLIDS